MDFSFMRTFTSNFSQPSKKHDRVVLSYNGYLSYLLIINKASRYIWVFLMTLKEPPLDIVDVFLGRFGHKHSRSIHTDQGGELACSLTLLDTVLGTHWYVMEPTGADRPSQNRVVEVLLTIS
jgi:hypothetical protein